MRHRTTVLIISKITYDMVAAESLPFHNSSRWFKRTPLQLFLDNYLWDSEELFSRKLPKLLFYRSSRTEVFCKKVLLQILRQFPGKHLCQSLFFNKFFFLFSKKETLAEVFSCEFCEICKSTFSIERLRWVLLFLHHTEAIVI